MIVSGQPLTLPNGTTSSNAFDSTASGYDASRRQLIPCFEQFYTTVLDLLAEVVRKDAPSRIIDLGAGTGLMSAMILEHFPDTHLTLVDAAENMLDIASQRLRGDSHRIDLVHADFLGYSLQGPYDAVVSALAIHHLSHAHKQILFAAIYTALKPGGRFINADQVCGPSAEIDQTYRQNWLRQVRENQVSEEALNAALGRMRHDIPAPLEDQLGWMTAAGFSHVACAFDGAMFAVYSGHRT